MPPVAVLDAPPGRKLPTLEQLNRTRKLQVKPGRSTAVRDVVKGLTAAAEVLTPADKKKLGQANPNDLTRAWQYAAFGYANTVPELSASRMYVGNCLSRIKLVVGKRNPDGTVERIPDGVLEPDPDDPTKMLAEMPAGVALEDYELALEVIAQVRSKVGGQSELLRSYGEKMFIAGELYLLPEDTLAGVMFECLSTMELTRSGDGYLRYDGPGTTPAPIAEGTSPIRIHRPDPQWSKLATSSVRACLEILEELVILTRLVRSSAISRMALSGILAIADEFDDTLDDAGEDGQTSEATNPLATDIINSGAKAIDDPSAAAAWLPYILQGPFELIEKGIRFIEFKHDDAGMAVKRDDAVGRLANGLDLPHESVTGHGDTTFANAGVISQDRFRIHLEPMVQMFVDAVSLGILWPGMARLIGLQPDDVEAAGYPERLLTVACTYDADDLVARPDRTKEIIEAFKADPSQMAFRLSELREAVGLSGDDGPDDAEVAKRINAIQLTKLRETAVAPAADAAEPIDGFPQAEPLPPVLPPEPVAASALLSVSNTLAQKIIGGAEVTLERCAERLGSQARDKLKKIGGVALAVIDGTQNADVARILGPEQMRELVTRDPVPAELAAFARTVARWAREAGHPEPGRVAQEASGYVAKEAAERLYGSASGLSPAALISLVQVPL